MDFPRSSLSSLLPEGLDTNSWSSFIAALRLLVLTEIDLTPNRHNGVKLQDRRSQAISRFKAVWCNDEIQKLDQLVLEKAMGREGEGGGGYHKFVSCYIS